MATREGPPALLETPQERLNFVPAKEGEIIKLGPLTLRSMEDGSRTGTNILMSFAYVQLLFSLPAALIILQTTVSELLRSSSNLTLPALRRIGMRCTMRPFS